MDCGKLNPSGESPRPVWPFIIATRQWLRWLLWLLGPLLLLGPSITSAVPPPQGSLAPVPILAYYYIWFNPSSWNRAKTDYPLLGRYSSDDRTVMRRHAQWARAAGIDGFIVSWKGTDKLNRRLEQLIEVASAEGLSILMIYQGLDFEREPLPADRIARDLDLFSERYADDQVFSLFERPVVIWSGSWEFSRDEVAQVVETRRERLLILASERNVEGYTRLADLVDGNAYYWSSVNPETYPGYPEKLQDMGEAVHAHGGLWIAPAAPGFDARLLGGTRVVERRDGETLRQQMAAALQSSPDAIGLISWNEFSENTHIEPSQNHVRQYLEVLSDIRDGVVPVPIGFDSSDPAGTQTALGSGRWASLGMLAIAILASLAVIARRR